MRERKKRKSRAGEESEREKVREKNYISKKETGEREGNVKREKERRWRKCRRS